MSQPTDPFSPEISALLTEDRKRDGLTYGLLELTLHEARRERLQCLVQEVVVRVADGEFQRVDGYVHLGRSEE